MDSASSMDMDTRSNSVVSMASTDGPLDGRSGSVTLDDPDVRLAAEALGDLRAGKPSLSQARADQRMVHILPTGSSG